MRALLRPKALISHVLVLTVAIVCVALGQWQLERLDSLRTSNALAEERMSASLTDLGVIADPNDPQATDVDGLEYRRVEVTGTYRPDEEVLQRNRSHQNQSGFHVLTPLELTDGGVILVRRGWVPAELDEPPVAEAVPDAGEVAVSGVLEAPVEQPDFGASDPDEGTLRRVFHTDTERLNSQISGELFPMVLRVDTEPSGNPTIDDLPVPPGTPMLDERNHFSYAMQWHAFGLLALVTYLAWWLKRLRRPDSDDDRAAENDADPTTGGINSDSSPERPEPASSTTT